MVGLHLLYWNDSVKCAAKKRKEKGPIKLQSE
jgi:hypothetical protein